MNEDIVSFIKVFIYAEGNISQTEKLLNCSYPKIKNLLRKTKEVLGVSENENDKSSKILDDLQKGTIDIETALNQIKKIHNK